MSARPRRRVAVTGLGALSPGGRGLEAYRRWRGGEAAPGDGLRVPGFNAADFISNPKLLRSMHRSFELVAAAAVLAMRAAGLPRSESLASAGLAPERAGIASALADLSPLTQDLLEVLAQTSPRDDGQPIAWAQFAEISLHHLHPFRRLTLLANMATAHTSLLYGLQGPSLTLTSGAAAGVQAITQAFWTVAQGEADLMLCQTADSPDQTFAAQPPPEVAGAVVLEDRASALRRGAVILCELVPGRVAELATPAARFAGASALSPVAALMRALVHLEDAPRGSQIELAALQRPRAEVPPFCAPAKPAGGRQ